MKVLIYSHFFLPSVGGVERLVDSLARGFSEKGVPVTVATATPAGAFDDRELPFPVVRRPGLAALLGLIRRHDVVHLAGPALLPMFLAYLLRVPVVIEHHMYQAVCPNGLFVHQPDHAICPGHFMAGRHAECLHCNAGTGRWNSFRMWLLAFPRLWLSRRATANVAVTEHVGRRLQLPHCLRIYHGTAVVPPAGPLAVFDGRQEAPVCFAYVGRFVSEKGLPLLIEAATRLQRDGLPFRLKFIGDGPERANLESAVRTHDLQDRTTFTGMLGLDDLRRETAEVTVVVMPSVCEETSGMAAIEQMMRGRAVVAADIGGLGEVVDGAGLKFPPGDVAALAGCMRSLVEDQALARRTGEAGRSRALALFRLERRIDDHLGLCQSLCQEQRRGHSG